jgi:hypothetical protein
MAMLSGFLLLHFLVLYIALVRSQQNDIMVVFEADSGFQSTFAALHWYHGGSLAHLAGLQVLCAFGTCMTILVRIKRIYFSWA